MSTCQCRTSVNKSRSDLRWLLINEPYQTEPLPELLLLISVCFCQMWAALLASDSEGLCQAAIFLYGHKTMISCTHSALRKHFLEGTLPKFTQLITWLWFYFLPLIAPLGASKRFIGLIECLKVPSLQCRIPVYWLVLVRDANWEVRTHGEDKTIITIEKKNWPFKTIILSLLFKRDIESKLGKKRKIRLAVIMCVLMSYELLIYPKEDILT